MGTGKGEQSKALRRVGGQTCWLQSTDWREGAPTMWHGACKDEGSGAAAHSVCRVVAGMDVNPVFCEVPQAAQYRSLPGNLVLLNFKIRVVFSQSEKPSFPAVPLQIPGNGMGQRRKACSQSPSRHPHTCPSSPLGVLVDGCHFPWGPGEARGPSQLPGALSIRQPPNPPTPRPGTYHNRPLPPSPTLSKVPPLRPSQPGRTWGW